MDATHVPDPAGLRLLLAVDRTGSIGGAARELGVSQQAASERMRGIEAQTGLTLIRRGPRGSELTDSGVVVTAWAARLIDLTDEIEAAIVGLRERGSRELTVWASMTIADALMPGWLVRLRERQLRQGVRPTVVSLTAANSQHVEDAVAEGSAHLGFVEGLGAPRHLRSSVIAEDHLVLVVAPGQPLARRRRALSPTEVAELPRTGREPGSGTREVVERALADAGAAGHSSVLELPTSTAIRESVLAGGAPAFLSRRVVQRELDAGQLVVVPTALDVRRKFRAVWAGGAHPPAGPARDLVGIARRTRPVG